MVLRRPYAFLIKYFRLIHLFITAILSYVVIQNHEIYKFLKSVIKDSVNRYDAGSYISYRMFVWLIIALILCGGIYYLLKFKDKPRKIYLITIIGYILVAAYLTVLFTYMNGLVDAVIDQKTIRLYTDILVITMVFQYIILVIMLIRGLGFDIKRFNFSKDVHELNLEEGDSEEVEINTQVDTTNVMRMAHKGARELGYFYMEFKVYIFVILIALISFLGYRFYSYFNTQLKTYTENDNVGSVNVLNVKKSYYIEEDGLKYVVINFDISRNGKREQLNINNLALSINNHEYLPNKNKCNSFNKYGTCYKKQYLTSKTSNYIAVYEINEKVKNNNYLIYSEFYDTKYRIKLSIKK